MSSPYLILPNTGLDEDAIEWDSVDDYSCDESSVATEHPVEDGEAPVDHIRPLPRVVSFTAYVSETPIRSTREPGGQELGEALKINIPIPVFKLPFNGTPGAIFREIGAIGSLLGGSPAPYQMEVLGFPVMSRVLNREIALERIRATKTLCRILTPTRQHDSMALVGNIHAIREHGGAYFQLTFRQIRTVATRIVDAPTPVEPRGAPMKKGGAQAGKTPDKASAKTAAEKASLILQGLQQLGGLVP